MPFSSPSPGGYKAAVCTRVGSSGEKAALSVRANRRKRAHDSQGYKDKSETRLLAANYGTRLIFDEYQVMK